MKIIDAIGLKCPMPLIKTKKAITEQIEGESLKILIDNEASKKNVMQFLTDNHIEYNYLENDGVHELIINKQDQDISEVPVEDYCEVSSVDNENFTLVFAKNTIGEGEQELGQMLVAGFLNTFKEMDRLPDKILFMNSGIDLVLNDAPTVDILKEYEHKGVKLLVCGTCLEYYQKMDEVAVGRVSNAYDILNATLDAGKIINF